MPKNWCYWTVVLEKTLESRLDCKEIQPAHPKGDQSWVFIGRTDTEAPILWPPDAKSWLIRKDPDAGKDWKEEENRMTEDEMVGWRHRLNGHEPELALRDDDRQGSLACCSPWGCKESDTTERLNWKKANHLKLVNSVLFLIWEEARVWAYWNQPFDVHLNYLEPVSYFSASWIPSRWAVADDLMAATSFLYWYSR